LRCLLQGEFVLEIPQLLDRVLAQHSAFVDMTCSDADWTCLHLAMTASRLESVQNLLELGANPNAACQTLVYHRVRYQTPLTLAFANEDMSLVKEIMAHGADPMMILPGIGRRHCPKRRMRAWISSIRWCRNGSGMVGKKKHGYAKLAKLFALAAVKTVSNIMLP